MSLKKIVGPDLFTGFSFSVLWASASVAAKFGLLSVEPLVLFNIRFLLAGGILLGYLYLFQKNRLPSPIEWKQIIVFGTFNTTLYLGIFILALQFMTAGVTTLAIALNPLFISILSAVWAKRRVTGMEWLSILLGMLGVFIAAYPLLQTSQVTLPGLLLMALSMGAYSFGSVYYSSITWSLPRAVINAWQVLIGGIMIVPLTWFMHNQPNHFDLRFWFSVFWLIIPVSIAAVQLWMRLLKSDPVQASLWLYLCPIFGFLYSALLLNEAITTYTAIGTVLVLGAVFIGRQKKVKA